MLEILPSAVGHLMEGVRSGCSKLMIEAPDAGAAPALQITSAAFGEGGAIPPLYTADGAKLSPPLEWSGVPEGAAALVLVIEDADSPTPNPLVHAIVHDLSPEKRRLDEGELPGPAGGADTRAMGRNSYGRTRYLPPDPPPGHGPHRYAFELFALDRRPDFTAPPGRRKLGEALRGHVVAKGCLTGTYERK